MIIKELKRKFNEVAPISMKKSLARELDLTRRYLNGLTSQETRLIEGKLSSAVKHFKGIPRLLKKRDYSHVDDFFFMNEDLPFPGKEYWFMNFVSTQGDKKQLVLTFGSAAVNTRVNDKLVSSGKLAVVGWLYSNKKKSLFNKLSKVTIEPGKIDCNEFSFTGEYPNYELRVGKRTHFKLTKRSRGPPFEINNEFVRGIGIGLVNLYSDVRGELDGEEFKGSCYVQKVVAITPFVPWNWVRVVFPDKSVFDFFAPRLNLHKTNYWLNHTGKYFDYRTKKTFELKNLKFQELGNGRWFVSGGGVTAFLRSYAFEPFSFKGLGSFCYDEYLVECLDFQFKKESKLGGIGILEDAHGVML